MKTTKLLPLFCLLTFCITCISAQNPQLDKYKKELAEHQQKDTIKVGILHDLAYEYFSIQRDSALYYFNQARALSSSLGYTKGLASTFIVQGMLDVQQGNYELGREAALTARKYFEEIGDEQGLTVYLNVMGNSYLMESKFRKAIPYFKEQLASPETHKDSTNLVGIHLSLGNSYTGLGEYYKAIIHLNKCLEVSKALDFAVGISYALNTLGMVYEDQGNYPLALQSYEESLAFKKKQKDSLGMSKTFNALGTLYKRQGKLNKALLYYEESLKIDRQFESKSSAAVALGNIGTIYRLKKDYEKALDYAEQSLKLSLETGNSRNQATAYNYLGSINQEQGQMPKARNYYLQATEICIENDYKTDLCQNRLAIAETYLAQSNFSAALLYVQQAQEFALKNNLLPEQKNIADFLSQIYENTGDYNKALWQQKLYKKLSDSLFNKEKIEKLTALEYEYKYKNQLDSASIRELKLNKTILDTSEDLAQTQRNYLWAIIGALLLAIASGVIIFYQKYNNIKTKNQNIVTEQKLLRSQMTPHFIFNSLAVLQGMILNKEEKKSISYLSKFSKLLRIILENSRDKTVLLSQELEAVNNYLSLHNIENDAYDYTLTVSTRIQTDTFKIPPMLIQPFIENAIEHAFPIIQDHMEIKVDVRLDGDILQCTIMDNGVGIDNTMSDTAFAKAEKNKSKSSLATTITEERLQILSKDFKVKGSLVVEDLKKYNEQGTRVTLNIPYKKTAA